MTTTVEATSMALSSDGLPATKMRSPTRRSSARIGIAFFRFFSPGAMRRNLVAGCTETIISGPLSGVREIVVPLMLLIVPMALLAGTEGAVCAGERLPEKKTTAKMLIAITRRHTFAGFAFALIDCQLLIYICASRKNRGLQSFTPT